MGVKTAVIESDVFGVRVIENVACIWLSKEQHKGWCGTFFAQCAQLRRAVLPEVWSTTPIAVHVWAIDHTCTA